MPHITNPVFAGGRIRELDTDNGWMKYVPPQGGTLEVYQFNKDDNKFTERMEQVKRFLLGYMPPEDMTYVSEEERNLIVYGHTTPPK